jgi:tRNA U34 5-methylaminomethyl-2-thiouridine-forming methyltransferase MnmC
MHSQRFELIAYPNGTHSVRDVTNGEPMHSAVGPWAEARALYVEQSRLGERLLAADGPLVIHDVGLGAAANALAAIFRREEARQGARPLHIVSFETEPAGLEFALAHADRFPYLAGYEDACRSLLERDAWCAPDGSVLWELRRGDYFSVLGDSAAPELIFYDFYAPASCPECWGLDAFGRLREYLRARSARATLLTYSAATRVRAAMVLAGFAVGYGRGTEMKTDTTVAATDPALLERPLGNEWLERFRRSGNPFPHGWRERFEDEKALLERLRAVLRPA